MYSINNAILRNNLNCTRLTQSNISVLKILIIEMCISIGNNDLMLIGAKIFQRRQNCTSLYIITSEIQSKLSNIPLDSEELGEMDQFQISLAY